MAIKWINWLGNQVLSVKAKRKTPEQPVRDANAPPIRTPIDPLLDDIDQVESRLLATNPRMDAFAGLTRAALRDAWAFSLLQVRTSGLCTLPVIYEGDNKRAVKKLTAVDEAGIDGFSRHFSRTEQALMLIDYITCGVAVGQFVLDSANDRKIVVRRTPDHLQAWAGGWKYNQEPIEAGDGSWVIMVAGLERGWLQGCGLQLARATTKRMLGEYNRLAFVAALANAISVINAPVGANEHDMDAALAAWSDLGTNNTKVLPAGWHADLLELKSAVGTAAFDKVTSDAKEDIAMLICGQTVTSSGSSGSGFINVKYFDAIRRDLSIKDASTLDQCIDEQVMPFLYPGVTRRIDLQNDNDKTVLAQRYLQSASAITALRGVYEDDAIDAKLLAKQLGLPLSNPEGFKKIEPAPVAPATKKDAPAKDLNEN